MSTSRGIGDAFPYLVTVVWNAQGPLTLLVESRDQCTMQILRVDPATGRTELVREDHDDRWLDITVGVPAWLRRRPPGPHASTSDDTKRLTFDDVPVTPVGLQVAQVLEVGDAVVFRANEDPTETPRVARRRGRRADPSHRGAGRPHGRGRLERHRAHLGHDDGPADHRRARRRRSRRHDRVDVGDTGALSRPRRSSLGGTRDLRMALFTPGGAEPDGPLPVLLDPYGGPHFAGSSERCSRFSSSRSGSRTRASRCS